MAGFTLHSIPDLGITFTIGLVTPIGDLSECGGPAEEFVSDSRGVNQTVSTPPGPDRNLDRIKGTLVLYDAVLTSDEDFCNLPTAEIGRGPGISINTDNDVHLDGPGADAFGGTLTATLDLTGGGRAHLLLVTRAVVLPDGSFETKVDRFELKPIGG